MRSTFELAPMDRLIGTVTTIMIGLPLILIVGAVFGMPVLLIPAGFLVVIYLWIWLRFRPTRFEIDESGLEIIWPLKTRRLDRREISDPAVIDRSELYSKVGWCVRVGAGGIWGGFGWLWTQKRGIVQMYISRVDEYVWFETSSGRAWLITPDRPSEFVNILAGPLDRF